MPHQEPEIPFLTAICTYFSYGLLIALGHVRDFIEHYLLGYRGANAPDGYAPLLRGAEDFYTRRLYHRIQDCWNRPVNTCPGARMNVMVRDRANQTSPLELTGEERDCLNLGSYNYLGFGDPVSPTKPYVFEALEQYSVSTTTFRSDAAGNTKVHQDLEACVAKFVGKEDAMVFGMGFGTNSTAILSLMTKGSLIISDALNHSSIVVGARSADAKIKVFKHNDAKDLERVIRKVSLSSTDTRTQGRGYGHQNGHKDIQTCGRADTQTHRPA